MNRSGQHGFLPRALYGMLRTSEPVPAWWQQAAATHARRTGDDELLLRLAVRPEVDPDTAELLLAAAADPELDIPGDVAAHLDAATRRNCVDGVEKTDTEQHREEVRLLGGFNTPPASARLTAIAQAALTDRDRMPEIRSKVVEAAGLHWTLEHAPRVALRHVWEYPHPQVDDTTFGMFCAQARALHVVSPPDNVRMCPSAAALEGNVDVLFDDHLQQTVRALSGTAAEVEARADSTEIVDRALQLQHGSRFVTVALLNAAVGHVTLEDLPRLLSGLTYETLDLWAPRPVAGLDRDGGRWLEHADLDSDRRTHRWKAMTRVLVDLHGRDGLVANRAALGSRLDGYIASHEAVPSIDGKRAVRDILTALPLDLDVAGWSILFDTQVAQVAAFVAEDTLRLQVLADVVDGAGRISLRDALATAEALLH